MATTSVTSTRIVINENRVFKVVLGAAAGFLAGLFYGVLLSSQQISAMMNPSDAPGDVLTNILFSAVIGAVFALCLGNQATTAGKSMIWGVVLSVGWWVLGPLTLFPVLNGVRPTWAITAAREAFPLLVGLTTAFGAFLGLIYWFLVALVENGRDLQLARHNLVNLGQAGITGGLAGLIGGWVFGSWMYQAGFFPLVAGLVNATDVSTGQTLHFLISIIIGVSYGILFIQDTRTLGAGVAWGTMYGFIWWVLGPLTLMPWLLGEGVQWGLAAAQEAFPSLLGHLLYGITLGVVQSGLTQLWRVLFVESDPLNRQPEGPGTRNLRALGVGAVASIGGGLTFSIVMISTDALPTVAALAGMTSPISGFLVHMVISVIIGGTYGLLFRPDVTSTHTAIGWGLVYGTVWWLLGPLTLMPLLLGLPLQWSLEAASNNFPSLIGHLLYGLVLALLYVQLAKRYKPRQSHRETQELAPSSAIPALWLLVILFLLFMLLLLN